MHDIIFHYPVTFVRRYYFVLLGISSLSHVGPKTDRSARDDSTDSDKNKTSGIYQDIDLQKEKKGSSTRGGIFLKVVDISA